jgi:DNA-binding transcriptional LysR family regulator
LLSYTLKQLTHFIAAADHGSTVAAARSLKVSQPSISASLAKLEDELGGQLFIRHQSRGLLLTSFGSNILAHARNLLQHAAELEREAAASGQTVKGTLDIGSFYTLAPFFVPSLLVRFTSLYAGTDVRLHECGQDQLFGGLERGMFPVACLYDENVPGTLQVEPLKRLYPYLLLPADHPLAGSDGAYLSDIVHEPMILFDVVPSGDYVMKLFHRAGLEPSIRFRSPSLETVRGLVGHGMGISILITRPSGDRTYDDKALSCVKLKGDIPFSSILIARLATMRPTRLQQAFWDMCLAEFAMPTNPIEPPGGRTRPDGGGARTRSGRKGARIGRH